jgi:hypothetical protein
MGDDASGDRGQHVVAAGTDLVMAPRAMVVDDVALVAVFLAQALAAPQVVRGTTAVLLAPGEILLCLT